VIAEVSASPQGVDDPDGRAIPNSYELNQNYPNPFNPSTTITFGLPARARVSLEVFNLLGQKVRTLAREYKAAGTYQIDWNGRDENGKQVATGVYFYRLQAEDYVAVKKMMLMK
jgi:hypothetical protein